MRHNLIFLIKVYFWVEVYLFALHTIFYKRYGLNCVAAKRKHTFIGAVCFAGGTFSFTKNGGIPMKTRKLLISILTGLCLCLTSATLLTACKDEHTHSYTQQTTTEATCMEKGVITFTCSCNDTYTEEIPATGEHTWE